jgi:hypothetical protein
MIAMKLSVNDVSDTSSISVLMQQTGKKPAQVNPLIEVIFISRHGNKETRTWNIVLIPTMYQM